MLKHKEDYRKTLAQSTDEGVNPYKTMTFIGNAVPQKKNILHHVDLQDLQLPTGMIMKPIEQLRSHNLRVTTIYVTTVGVFI